MPPAQAQEGRQTKGAGGDCTKPCVAEGVQILAPAGDSADVTSAGSEASNERGRIILHKTGGLGDQSSATLEGLI